MEQPATSFELKKDMILTVCWGVEAGHYRRKGAISEPIIQGRCAMVGFYSENSIDRRIVWREIKAKGRAFER